MYSGNERAQHSPSSTGEPMKTWQMAAAALLLVGPLTGLLAARVPAPPAAPGAVAPAPAAPPVPTVWNKLGITKQGCADCRARCCQSPLGQLLNNMTKPLSFATGGLMP